MSNSAEEKLTINLSDILDRCENIQYSREFNYAQQAAINSKPSIIATNESLKEYPLSIKLHRDFCDPQVIIDEIEEKAANREPIQYFQNSKYIGAYVIDRYSVNISQKIDDKIIYAELELKLLEAEDFYNKDFETQTIKNVDLEKYTLNEAADLSVKSAKKQAFQNFMDNSYNTALSTSMSSVTSANASVFKNVCSSVLSNIKANGINQIFQIASTSADKISQTTSLSQTETVLLKNVINTLPRKVLGSLIR